MHRQAGGCDMRRGVREDAVAYALAQRTQELSPLHIDDLVIFVVSGKTRVMSPEGRDDDKREIDQLKKV
jgi:hypothetical protein